ncbi:MerR family DNA-binding protein [Neotabrizicola sp. VNH66]|uniref:MerR family DNA-binding protein n=1 Tax=Neotabrizicola sp. VNH66 TaxID=3400918 RepID=UPI003BFE0489
MSNQAGRTLREVSQDFGISVRTLRYYEYIELLRPRIVGTVRFYARRDIARLKLILRGKRFGMRLEDLRRWLNLYEDRGKAEQSRVWLQIADEREADLRLRIAELQSALSELQQVRDLVQAELIGQEPE